jgi:hypothetical protein
LWGEWSNAIASPTLPVVICTRLWKPGQVASAKHPGEARRTLRDSIRALPGRRQQDSVLINRGNRNIIGSQRFRFALMRYSLHETDKHRVVATTVAADRDEALEGFSEKLRLMLTLEGDPTSADYLLDEWPEGLPYMAHTPKPTIPVFVVRAMAAHPQASQGAGCGQTSA